MSDAAHILLQNPVILYTVCFVVLLVVLALFIKITGSNLESITRALVGLFSAAAKELSPKGGRVAKVNALLTLGLLSVFVLLIIPTVLGSIRAALSGTPPHGVLEYSLFVVLCVFFLISLWFVRSDEEYKKKRGRLPRNAAPRAAQEQRTTPVKAEPPATLHR